MLAPSEVGWDLTLYAEEWLEERFRLTLKLVGDLRAKQSPRTVHDVRVACRRLREAIGFFSGVPEVPPLSDVDRAARRLARVVRRLREIDVAMKGLARLRVSSQADPARKDLVTALSNERQEKTRKTKKLVDKRARQLARAIKQHLPLRVRSHASDVDPAREVELRTFAEVRVAARRSEVERRFELVRAGGGRVGSASEADRLHAIRVSIKRWRYASEIGRAMMPRVLYRPMAVRLRLLQELGGKSQDLTDLANVAEKALPDGASRAQKSILSSIRSLRIKASREFYDALKALVQPMRSDLAV